jgi:TRAP-type C4-dicarboxylate transport system permease small subunit
MLRATGLLAVLIFAALTGVVALQVVNRGVLHLPIIWSEELARFLFFWAVLLGAAMSVRRRRHFVLDLTMGRAPAGRMRRLAVAAFPDVCVLAFSAFLLVQGLDYVRVGVLRTATNSNVNMGLVYAAIPAFAALSLIFAGLNLVADYRRFRAGRRMPAPLPPAE